MPLKTEIWLDAQLSPALAPFITEISAIFCVAVRDLGMRDSADIFIFNKAKQHNALVIIITKDSDFVDLIIRLNSPPKIILLTCGNTSNFYLKKIFSLHLKEALNMLEADENMIIEISD